MDDTQTTIEQAGAAAVTAMLEAPRARLADRLGAVQAALQADMAKIPVLREALAERARQAAWLPNFTALMQDPDLRNAWEAAPRVADARSGLLLEQSGALAVATRELHNGPEHLAKAERLYADLPSRLAARPWQPGEAEAVLPREIREQIASVSVPTLDEKLGQIRGTVRAYFLKADAVRALQALGAERAANTERFFRLIAEGASDAGAVEATPPAAQEPATVTSPSSRPTAQTPTVRARTSVVDRALGRRRDG